MRALFYLLFIIFLSGHSQGQGFERLLDEDGRREIRDLKVINDSVLELDFKLDSWSLAGGTTFYKAWYFINEDRLGEQFMYHTNVFQGYSDLLRLPNGVLLNYYNNEGSCSNRYCLNMRVLDFNNSGYSDFPTTSFSFIAGAFNHLYINDSLFGYHGKALCNDLIFDLSDNSTLYYYYYDYRTGAISYLDTLQLPFHMEEPGSLLRHPKTGQNILFYDSLKVYISPGKSVLDSVVLDPSIMEDPNGGFNFGTNMQRHARSFKHVNNLRRSRTQIMDTLNSFWVYLDRDWFDSTTITRVPRLDGYENYFPRLGSLSPKLEEDSIEVYRLQPFKANSNRLILVSSKNGEVQEEASFVSGPTRTYGINAMGMDSQGNWYLAGGRFARPYIGRHFNDPNGFGFKQNVIIKIDSTGYSRAIPQTIEMSLQSWQGGLSFKIDDPYQMVDFQIIDLSGKLQLGGEGRSGDILDLSSLSKGLYYFQLWTKEGLYIGQRAFVQ